MRWKDEDGKGRREGERGRGGSGRKGGGKERDRGSGFPLLWFRREVWKEKGVSLAARMRVREFGIGITQREEALGGAV
jgi:hypothetical protein